MPSPLGITLMSIGQPSASCGYQPAKQCSREQRRPQGSQCALCWIRQTLQVSIPNQYLHTPTQGPATEASTTCFDGQYLPREPKDMA